MPDKYHTERAVIKVVLKEVDDLLIAEREKTEQFISKYLTKEESTTLIEELKALIPEPLQPTEAEKVDYDKILAYVVEQVSAIKVRDGVDGVGIKGKDGVDGVSPTLDIPAIVEALLKVMPKIEVDGVDYVGIKTYIDEQVKKIKPQRVGKSGGGATSLGQLTDVVLSGLTRDAQGNYILGGGGGGAVDSVNTRTGAVTGLAENSDLVAHVDNVANPHSVTKAQVGLSDVPNTDFTASIATKQDTLVSATNIKTINGTTVLGAGDLVVGDVIDANVRGGAANLNARLGTISNFASPNAGGVIPGQFYDNSFQGTASALLSGAANRIDLAPYYTSQTFDIDQIGVSVSSAVAASTVKIVIYSADANGWPDIVLYESSPIDTSIINYRFEALTFTFNSGVQYWVGVRSSSTASMRTINPSSAVNLGLTSSSATSYATILRRTLTYATAATSPWVFVNSDRVANISPPSIRFRAV